MRSALAILVLLAAGLSGCTEKVTVEPEDNGLDGYDVDVDETTGAILGVVVDQAIQPVEKAVITLTMDGRTAETDAEGRFAFDRLEPGTYFFQVERWGYLGTQATAEVEAGVPNPAIVKVQIERLYSEEPYLDVFQFNGYFSCALSWTVCVNDYSRLDPTGTCPGGCFGDEISSLGLNVREYIYDLRKDWHTITIESIWEPNTAGTSQELGGTVSFYRREGAGHSYGGGSGPSPLQFRFDMVPGTDHPEAVPPGGIEDFFVFFSTGGGLTGVAIEQEWETFQHISFHAPLPEGWAFSANDPDPWSD